MMVAATIAYSGTHGLHVEEKVYTSLEFASLDDLFNHLRCKYFHPYKHAHITLNIDMEDFEYRLILIKDSFGEEKVKVKLRNLPFKEQCYLHYLFYMVSISDELMDRWMKIQMSVWKNEDRLISDFTKKYDDNE